MQKVVCHDMDGKLYEVSPEQLVFRPSAYGVLIEDGKVLLSKQFDGYDFPGGGVKINESLEDAVVREFFEETGLRVKVKNVVYAGSAFFHPTKSEQYKGQFWNCPLIYFKVEKIGGELSTENFDVDEKVYAQLAEWKTIEEVDGLKYLNAVDSPALIKKVFKMI